jgi:hypothetical protein
MSERRSFRVFLDGEEGWSEQGTSAEAVLRALVADRLSVRWFVVMELDNTGRVAYDRPSDQWLLT